MNKIMLFANLASDPKEIKSPTFKTAAARLAVNDRDGAIFFDSVAYMSKADRLLSAHKGDSVLVSGTLHLDRWTDMDGKKRETLKIAIDDLAVLKRKNGEKKEEEKPADIADDELPF